METSLDGAICESMEHNILYKNNCFDKHTKTARMSTVGYIGGSTLQYKMSLPLAHTHWVNTRTYKYNTNTCTQ